MIEDFPEADQVTGTGYKPPETREARWIFDYDHDIWRLKAGLMGGYITKDKHGEFRVIIPKGAMPLMNTRGVESTITTVRGLVGKIQALTQLDEERIRELCLEVNIVLAEDYYLNMEEYGMNPTSAKKGLRMVMNLIETNMRKSYQGLGLRSMTQSERVTEVVQEKQKRRWL